MIIGLTGPNASGKGEAVLYIKSKGFIYRSLSDILREESAMLGIEPLRENLIKLGNELRRKNGPSFLALKAKEGIKETENYIIDSIRNPAEVEEFRKMDNFILIGIDAPVKIRFKRSIGRGREGDAKTLKEFIQKEEEENRNGSENQQLKKCLQIADVVVVNDSTLEELHRKIDEAIKQNKPC
jgi:dCMP deaminase